MLCVAKRGLMGVASWPRMAFPALMHRRRIQGLVCLEETKLSLKAFQPTQAVPLSLPLSLSLSLSPVSPAPGWWARKANAVLQSRRFKSWWWLGETETAMLPAQCQLCFCAASSGCCDKSCQEISFACVEGPEHSP